MAFVKKHLANIFSFFRIFGSIGMIFCPVFSASFYALYLFAGFTDMVDGSIARKMHAASTFGAKLDTLADMIFAAVILAKILPAIHIQAWLWIWMIAIACIKTGNIIWGFIRCGKFVSLHTAANKITGALAFLLPLSLNWIDLRCSLPPACVLASFAAIQESIYIGMGREIL